MREKDSKMVNTNLGILLICLFSAVFTMADFIVIDRVLDKYVDYSKCNCTKCDAKDTGIIGGNTDNTVEKKDEVFFEEEKVSISEEYPIVTSYVKYDINHVVSGSVIKINDVEKELLDGSIGISGITIYKGFVFFFDEHVGHKDLIIADSKGNFLRKVTSSDVEGRISNYYIKDDSIYLLSTTFGFDAGEICVDYQHGNDRNVKNLYRFNLIGDNQFSDFEVVETEKLMDYVNSNESVKEECSKDVYR